MWGLGPADSAISALELFRKNNYKEILIPGFGYGRNAKIFLDQGFIVTGIEISKTAIELAKKYFGDGLNIHHGSVNEMPFSEHKYDGIFCYALIHLLNKNERKRLIENCYHQIKPGGSMFFVAISKNTSSYGVGMKLSNNRFRTMHGVAIYFYDYDSINSEFGEFGLLEAREVTEPLKNIENKPIQKFWQIVCTKSN